ncbi:MAG: hypothetical protein ABR505_04605 [Actinomycetota bacterium]
MAKNFQPEKILEILARHDVAYVLIGGLAAIARLSPYMTVDVDICPSNDEENLKRLATALTSLGAKRITDLDPKGVAVEITPEYLAGENELAFMTPYGPLDIVFIPRGTTGYPDLRRAASLEEAFENRVLIPSAKDVIRMKDSRGLPKDRLVVEVLRKVLEREDKKDRR